MSRYLQSKYVRWFRGPHNMKNASWAPEITTVFRRAPVKILKRLEISMPRIAARRALHYDIFIHGIRHFFNFFSICKSILYTRKQTTLKYWAIWTHNICILSCVDMFTFSVGRQYISRRTYILVILVAFLCLLCSLAAQLWQSCFLNLTNVNDIHIFSFDKINVEFFSPKNYCIKIVT